MISSSDLHIAYNNLYKQMRKYIWSLQTVQLLANLEVAVYKAFPDVLEVRKFFDALRKDVKYDLPEDEDEDSEEFYKSFEAFEDKLNEADTIYNDIYTVSEVLVNEDNKESIEEPTDEGEWLGAEPEELDTEETDDTEEVDTF